jgi:hypothetical protein
MNSQYFEKITKKDNITKIVKIVDLMLMISVRSMTARETDIILENCLAFAIVQNYLKHIPLIE